MTGRFPAGLRFGRLPSPTALLRGTGLVVDPGAWVEDGRLLGCAYPRREAALATLARQGVVVLVNLHERAHDPDRLAAHGLVEVHLPVADFTAPAPAQIDRGVAEIDRALAGGSRVAVHCGGGLGRTGTLLACYLVRHGLDPAEAVARVRAARPGSIETAGQVAAVAGYAERLWGADGNGPRHS
jgi:atypical dual specificity phosphatase